MKLAVVAARHILRHNLGLAGHSHIQVVAELMGKIVVGSRCSDAVHHR
jgi:hypothetical protein